MIVIFVDSCSAQGDVRVWDPRFTKSTHSFNTMTGSNVCTIHHSVPLLAWYVCVSVCVCVNGLHIRCKKKRFPSLFLFPSASNQAIKLYNIKNKESINSIRYHDGFMGQKIGPTKSIIFHPYKVSATPIDQPFVNHAHSSYGWLRVDRMV